jgi:hypothetical protein
LLVGDKLVNAENVVVELLMRGAPVTLLSKAASAQVRSPPETFLTLMIFFTFFH